MTGLFAERIDSRRRRGRGAAVNPAGRFERLRTEPVDDGWESLAEIEALTTEVQEVPARRIITKNDSPDIGFDRSIDPYRGCEHGCVYCYARPTHAFLGLSPGLDFESKLFAKVNAPELLDHELTLILRGMDVTDGYDSMDVFIDLNPIVPSGFDTTQVSEFANLWDDSFDPFVRIEDNFPADCADVGGICTYIGWTVKDGDVVTFRYEVDSFPGDTRPPPTLFYNAFNVVVPEPGTALLIGLGLVGLSFAGRRGGREHS